MLSMQDKDSLELSFQGDKSIAHRLVLSSLLWRKKLLINNLPLGKDVLTSLEIIKKLGADFSFVSQTSLEISPFWGLKVPPFSSGFIELDCKNSGTTARLLCGILSNLKGKFKLIGDESLSKRPMEPVVRPLKELMAVDIKSSDGYLPVYINSTGETKAGCFENITASAQVKSAILFAGLSAKNETVVKEKIPSRDHTERLLKYLSSNNKRELVFHIPGDISSAAYFAVAAAITGRKICLKNLLLNPTRIGFLEVLKRMGVIFTKVITSDNWEPVGDLIINGGNLIATDVESEEIPSVIDELPILAVAMAFAKGKSRVSGALGLRVKESDRISCLISQLKKLAVNCFEKEDGYEITGGNSFVGADIDSFNDHRLAMSFAILAYAAKLNVNIKGSESVSISFPEFYSYLEKL